MKRKIVVEINCEDTACEGCRMPTNENGICAAFLLSVMSYGPGYRPHSCMMAEKEYNDLLSKAQTWDNIHSHAPTRAVGEEHFVTTTGDKDWHFFGDK